MFLTFYLRVFQGSAFLGFIVDISSKGMMLLSEAPLDEEKIYELSMKLPPGGAAESGSVEFTAYCKWSRPDNDNTSFYMSGFEIRDMDDASAAVVERLVNEYKLP